ncbi:FAD-dependent oxidoreductase [Chloroflexota bacterium]
MVRVVIAGGGIAGCGAAEAAIKAGAEVILLERTDLLLGSALVAGFMPITGGGGFCLAEETKVMGCDEILQELKSLDVNREAPTESLVEGRETMWRKRPYLYNCGRVEPAIRRLVERMGVHLRLVSRAVDVRKVDGRLTAVKLANGEWIEGDAFVDCTGTAGGLANCIRYGKGCVMCPMYRCPSFGDRVSIAGKAGAAEFNKLKPDGTPGILSPEMHFYKESLSPALQAEIAKNMRVAIDIREEIAKGIVDPSEYDSIHYAQWARWGFDPETGKAHADETGATAFNKRGEIVLVDRFMPGVVSTTNLGYISYEKLRQIPGFENAIVAFPQGGRGNFVHYLSQTVREESLRVKGFQNLFVAGEKACVVTVPGCLASGLLAGHNAVRAALGKDLLVLPRSTVTGDYLAYCDEMSQTDEGIKTFWVCYCGVYLRRIIDLGLCLTDADKIRAGMETAGLAGVYATKLV